ncbi:MAG: uracil-DNA glycosylase [Nitrospira sp.]|nr:uracil-DNA glycosylase [Nitrospira sp.]
MVNIAEDIKNILEFYQALGFERLPLNPPLPPFTKGGQGGIKVAALNALKEDIGECKRCKLSKGRTHIVFGEGRPDAKLMFIGEAPGREEDIQARPFVGDAGMLLTRLIEKMGFKREDVYITNVVKCRPPINRDPEKDEIQSCIGFLERQIEIIHPEIIMSLGRISTKALIGDEELKLSAIRGKFFKYKGVPLMPTFHPAYLLRNPKDKWLTWNDAQKVIEKLNESGKDRGGDITWET